MGPSAVIGYKTKQLLAVINPQYYFGIGSRGDRDRDTPPASYMSMLYVLIFNLPDAWQVGTNPAISYDYRASSGNKWNVPIGGFVAKTTKVGKVPVKFELGAEYSVVSQRDFGQIFQVKLYVIPVIPSLVKNPIFGGE